VGVLDGAALLPVPVHPAGDPDGPAGLDRVARAGVRVPRRCPGPDRAGQPEGRRAQAGPVRPEDQPGVRRAGPPLRRPDRPGPRLSPQGQAEHRGAPAVHPLQLLRRPGLAEPGGDGRRRGALVHRRRGPAQAAGAGGPHPGRGARRRGSAGAAAAARGGVRAGGLEPSPGCPGCPCQGGPHAVLAAVQADRPAARRPRRRHGGRVLPGCPAGQDPPVPGAGAAHRLGRPARAQGRVLHAHPGVVPVPGRAGRPGLRRPGHRAARGRRAVPAPPGPGGAAARRQARRPPAGSRLPARAAGRRPVLQDGQGHPGRREGFQLPLPGIDVPAWLRGPDAFGGEQR